MTRPIRLTLFALLLIAALVAAAIPSLLPEPAAATPTPHWRPDLLTVRGGYHVHSRTSDGAGSLDEIASAAARAGLRFVILTDHGDATRQPDPPRYLSGVLCIEAVEINTQAGHLVALDARPSPYPLAGAASAVLEDVHRLGGIGVAAHPGSPRRSLQWSDWKVAVDGVEWLNADSEWRDELLGSLGRLLLTYFLRPAETLTAALDRPDATLSRWDALTAVRRVVGLAGADAHGRLGFGQQAEPFEEGFFLPIPSYEAAFKAFGLRVLLDAPLSGDPERDAGDILARLRRGRAYTVVDGLATPGDFQFSATSAGRSAGIGDDLEIGGEVVLHARMAAPTGSRLVILRNGTALYDTRDPEAHLGVGPEPAVYRVEIYAPGATGQPPIPWLVSNPIYVGMRAAHEAAARLPGATPASRRTSISTGAWVAEASPSSSSALSGTVAVDGVSAIPWAFQLAGGTPSGQYAAVRFPVEQLAGLDRLQLRARASQPMRIWVQLRASTLGDGERWGRTLYLDAGFQTIEVRFDQLQPIGATSTAAVPLDRVDVLLLVVDTLNTRPGASGTIHLADLWLAQPEPPVVKGPAIGKGGQSPTSVESRSGRSSPR